MNLRAIRTPDQRLRVFVSSTLAELATERAAVRRAIERLHLTPVMFELGAKPYPPQAVYRAYLAQSDVFAGIYWQSYGWVAPGEDVSGLEDEFRLSAPMPRLLYVREPAERDDRLEAMLDTVRQEGSAAYKVFATPDELETLIADDLAVLLSERFQTALGPEPQTATARRPSALIAPDNPIIGRDTEIAAVTALLRRPDVRMVTLTGAAGIGKSRLAIELAQVLAGDFPDGVHTVLLESVRDPALVMSTIAGALGARSGADEEPLARLKDRLEGQRVLLILDNFEQVSRAALDVADLLGSCGGVKALVTSRVPLLIRGEQEYPVLPLAIPDPDRASVEVLANSPAVRMFVTRAEAAGAPVAQWDDEIRTIARICQRLDGLPLAIEFAVARARLLPPRQLFARLDHRLALLTGGSRDAPVRHRTLRAAIDWGHELLEPDEQAALRRLAAFLGGWTLGAAEEVVPAAGRLGSDSLDTLESLLLKSFVIRSPVPGPEPRFRLLETIREYADEKLTASPDLEATRDAHAAYFLAFAEQAAPETHGPDQGAWLDALERDHGNLRRALEWFAEHDGERMVRLAVALGRFWMVHCHHAEALDWLGRARTLTAGRQDQCRVEVLSWLGTIAVNSGDFARAEVAHTEALPIRRALADRHGEHIELLSLGGVRFMAGDVDTAMTRWGDLLTLTQERGDDDIQARALNNLAIGERIRGNFHESRAKLERAIRLHRPIDPHAAAIETVNLAGVTADLGAVEQAADLAIGVIREAQALGDVSLVIEGLEAYAAAIGADYPLDAAWLFGLATRQRHDRRLPRSGAETPVHEREVQRARDAATTTLQAEAFDRAWSAGENATLDEGVARALQET